MPLGKVNHPDEDQRGDPGFKDYPPVTERLRNRAEGFRVHGAVCRDRTAWDKDRV